MPCLLAAAVVFVFSLQPGTWWEFRESYSEPLGGIDRITDETTRFEVRGSVERPFLQQTGGADPGPGPVEAGEGWIRLGPWTGEDALPLPLAVGRTGAPPSEGGPAWTVEAEEEVTRPRGDLPRAALRVAGPPERIPCCGSRPGWASYARRRGRLASDRRSSGCSCCGLPTPKR